MSLISFPRSDVATATEREEDARAVFLFVLVPETKVVDTKGEEGLETK